jgi:hypothetical protein
VFQQAFLNTETRSYDAIDTETLAQWARTFKGVVPENAPVTPEAQIKLSDPDKVALYQEFTDTKRERFGDIGHVLSVFYEAPEDIRDQIKDLLPQIDDYYSWRNEQFAKNPDLIPFAISDTSKVADAPREVQALYYQYQYQREQMFPDVFELQEQYFKLESSGAKKKFRAENPSLPEYWEWRREFMRQYPNMIPYLMSEEALAEAVLGEERSYSGGGGGGSSKKKDVKDKSYDVNISQLAPQLKERLLDHYLNGTPLGKNTRKKLREFWESQGSPGEKLNDFIRGPLRQELYVPSGAPEWNAQDIDINQLDPIVVKRLNAYYVLDEPLSNGVLKALKKVWNDQGKPGDTFEVFVDDLLRELF